LSIYKCSDCGVALTDDNRKHQCRKDICDTCWENRSWLVDNRLQIDINVFRKIQRAMASHRGTAKKQIESLKLKVEGGKEINGNRSI
jgi:hypothetical protein